MKPTVNRFRKPKVKIIIPDRVAHRAATKYVEDDHGCWISTYSKASHGYAQIGWQEKDYRQVVTAHRAAWVYHNGRQIPEGHTVDHLCKERPCVNPEHLRCLDNFQNARRTFGRDWKLGECANGHPDRELYWDGSRYRCKPCTVERGRKWAKNNPEKKAAAQRKYRAKKNAQ